MSLRGPMHRSLIKVLVSGILAFLLILPANAQNTGRGNPPVAPTNPKNAVTSQVPNTYWDQVQSYFESANQGDCRGLFKLYYIFDGDLRDGNITRRGIVYSGRPYFRLSNIKGTAGFINGGWQQIIGFIFSAGVGLAYNITNPIFIATAVIGTFLISILTANSSGAVTGGLAIFRAVMVVLVLPAYTWLFIGVHNTMIFINNLVYESFSDIRNIANPSSENVMLRVENIPISLFNLLDNFGATLAQDFALSHEVYNVFLNLFVALLYILGIFAIFATIFSGFGTSICRNFGKAWFAMYMTFITWNIVAAIAFTAYALPDVPDVVIFLASEALYLSIPAFITAVMISGGNPAGAVMQAANQALNNAAPAFSQNAAETAAKASTIGGSARAAGGTAGIAAGFLAAAGAGAGGLAGGPAGALAGAALGASLATGGISQVGRGAGGFARTQRAANENRQSAASYFESQGARALGNAVRYDANTGWDSGF
jgi:hypothetical protein